MNINIYKHEFRANLKSVITWSASLASLLFVFTALFPAMARDAALLNETLAQMPPELLTAFGMNGMDLSSVLGFFSFEFIFCQICFAIQAANYGFALILTSKLLAALTGLTITNLVVWVSSFVFINMFKDGRAYDTKPLVLLLLSIVVFQLFFLSVGILFSLFMKRVRSVTSASMALSFGMYVLSAFGGMLGADSFDLITPFKHFDPTYIITNATYNVPLALISVAVIVVSIAGSYMLYGKRNIQTAI